LEVPVSGQNTRGEAYDVVIVGAGPAGIFAALELSQQPGIKVLLLDKGSEVSQRQRAMLQPRDQGLDPLLHGWGGAGAFSDGKLILSSEIGGDLAEYVGREEATSLVEGVDATYLRFGGPERVYGVDPDETERLAKQAALAHLRLVAARVRHLGTERCKQVLENMYTALKDRVEIRMETEVCRLLTDGDQVHGIETGTGQEIMTRFVILAPGRAGSEWLSQEAARLGLELSRNPVDVGVRVEVPATVLEHITDRLYESKLLYYSPSFDDKVRTFCMCPYGEVVLERLDRVVTVNGHSYAHRRTANTNFAILVSKTFTEPFREPIAYGKHIAALANLLADGIIVQRLGDLEQGRRSTPERLGRSIVIPTLEEATPGDLGLVLPYRHLVNILEMLEAMDQLAPGIYARDTLLYGVEVKFYSSKLELSRNLETRIANAFAIGDGAGVTRGLVQASASAMVAAREILSRL
jgi:uncharacterized FAD-dependent dehydrogenase